MTAFWYAFAWWGGTMMLGLAWLAAWRRMGRIASMLHLKEILAALQELNRFLRSVPWDKLVEIVEKLDEIRTALEEKSRP